jgi:Family of unknown function (DUF5996)
MSTSAIANEPWPALPLAEWKPTRDTLHLWTQMAGKLRLKLSPAINHWWHVPLYVTAHGLSTGAMPYRDRTLQASFDFHQHAFVLKCNDRGRATVGMYPRSVADFYEEFRSALRQLDVEVKIWSTPVEVIDPIPFEKDNVHASYDRAYVERFARALQSITPILQEFRGNFVGKSSPVHFFWGSFDMALTRFSGRRAPERPGVDPITREAYSHEVISAGWWPGGDSPFGPSVDYPAFYEYAAPEPDGFASASVRPREAFYHSELHEYLLAYDAVRNAADPRQALLDFLQSTYDAGATLGKWDRDALEKQEARTRRIA